MMNAVNERLATQIQEQYQLNQPIKADRGDPFAIQVKDNFLSKFIFLITPISDWQKTAD